MEELYSFNMTPATLDDYLVSPAASNFDVLFPPHAAAMDHHLFNFSRPILLPSPPPPNMSSSSSSARSDADSVVVVPPGGGGGGGSVEEEVSGALRAKVASHPLYPKLLHAYIDCQKVGAPPEIKRELEEIRQGCARHDIDIRTMDSTDPELDEFMETYCDVLVKYKSDLSRPFNEAASFLKDMEAQFNTLCPATPLKPRILDESVTMGSSEDEAMSEEGDGDGIVQNRRSRNVDPDVKEKLLRKYSGYISSLKNEFSKKKKNGKLPNEARQLLLNWWDIHYRWPYPTEADKAALADATGLDQKQINNWFINQRKRHWRPTESMQIAVVDNLYGPYFL